MQNLKFPLMAFTASLMVSACAPQTPASVINGYGHKTRTVASSTVSKSTSKTALTKPQPLPTIPATAMTSEELVEVSPAVGQIVPAKVSVAPKPVVEAVKPAVELQPTEVEHKVVATDTIYKLARQYNTTAGQILKDNGFKATSDIREGQTLKISSNSKPQGSAWDDMKKMLSATPMDGTPQAQVAAVQPKAVVAQPVVAQAEVDRKLASIEPAAGERPKVNDGVEFENYTVQPKETIYRISLKYNVSVLDIMAANDFEQPQDLKADAVIKVPVKKTISEQLVAKADIAPAAGADTPAAAVVVESVGKPVQVAMLSAAPVGAKEAQQEDLESKAVKQQAFKDAVMPAKADKPLSAGDEQKAEAKRGQIDKIAAASSGLVWPVKGQILKRFGDDGNGVARTGINIAVPKGTSVLASEGGTVLYADDGLKIYGKMVLVRHDNGMVSAYAHNGYLLVKKNERVKKGQVIALSGATGNVESPQLHFELRQHASAIDPMRMLPSL